MFGHVDMDQSGRNQLPESTARHVRRGRCRRRRSVGESCPYWRILSLALPRNIRQVHVTPKRMPVRKMAESAFCAACVPSQSSGGSAQNIAIAAGLAFFAKVIEQHLTPAAWRFAIGEQGSQACVEIPPPPSASTVVLYTRPSLHAVGHPGFRSLAVAASATGL